MTIPERLAWIVIYLNFPLWIAVIILAFVFGQWATVKILVGVNVVLLLTSYIWYSWRQKNGLCQGN